MMTTRQPRNKRAARINFGSGVMWTAVSVMFDEATIDNPHVCLEVRVMAAARARIDPTGHSHWRRGELRSRLVGFADDDGEGLGLVPVHRNTLAACVARLTAAGILLPGSGPMCLVYAPFAVQTGMTNGAWPPCPNRGENP